MLTTIRLLNIERITTMNLLILRRYVKSLKLFLVMKIPVMIAAILQNPSNFSYDW